MFQGESVNNSFSSGLADCGAQISVRQQGPQCLHQLFQTIHWNKPSVAAVVDDLVNSLPAACDHRLTACHGFQINTSQAFVAARQHKDRTAAHGRGYLATASPPEEVNPV